MSEIGKRLTQVAKDFNIGTSTISEFLLKKGLDIGSNPNARITPEMYRLLEGEFQSEKNVKEASEKLSREHVKRHTVSMDDKKPVVEEEDMEDTQPPLLIKDNTMPKADVQKTEAPKVEAPKVDIPVEKTGGLKVVGKIELEGDRKAREKKEADEKAKLEAERIALEIETANEKARIEKLRVEEEAKAIEAAKKAQEAAAVEEVTENSGVKVVGKIDLDSLNQKTHPGKASKKKEESRKEPDGPSSSLGINKKKDALSETPKVELVEKINPVVPALDVVDAEDGEPKFFRTEVKKLTGPKVLGKIELPSEKIIKKQPVASSADDPERQNKKKKKRKRLHKEGEDKKVTPAPANPTGEKATLIKKTPGTSSGATINKKKKRELKPEVSEEDIQKQIKETLARLSDNTKSKAVKYRRHKRDLVSQKEMQEIERAEQDSKVLKVTEFVSANELANMMNLSVNQIISTCMTLGMFVSINQRLDAETIVIVAEEFGYRVEFVSADLLESMKEDEIEDNPEDYVDRPPIVTVMGHVDHGKTSLLDYIRKTNVIAGEAGGITQHIGAYEVMLESGKHITFLDTPGHEAFTAMRARGSKITDIAVIVVAADDNIMPQTREAINHAQAANVPMVFAINKIDKPNAQPEKIKESLAAMNLLVEDWGGKYQSQDIAAKHGLNVDLLMEKILLEAELLELKGNPKRQAQGVVLEASLDKGKGYVAKILVQNGTLNIGDMVLAGTSYGKVKAMFNERNQSVKIAGPSVPVLLLGLNSAPQAGDAFTVMADEKEAKGIATKREQLQREQGVRTQKHITLDEIGRRLAIGDFKELNIIVKADMDGSVEALSDSLIKLSTEEIQVNIIHKSVGQVSESDVLLASASDAIIIAFQVRPSLNARKLAEQEQIDIRIYSVIYKAIEEVKAAMEGMLSPDVVENIVCSIEIRDVFKITKVGSVAGCYVMDGKVTRNTPIRIIRDGIVVYSGKLGSLKRFKDDVKEVNKGFECGLNIDNFNDIKVGDIIEGYELTEVKRTLA